MKREYLLRSAVNPKLSLGQSKIQGRGAFAREKILPGEKLMEFGGEAISRAQMETGDYRIRSIWPVARRDRSTWPHQFRRAAHFLDYAAGGLGAVTRINEGLPRYRDNGWLGPRLRNVEVASREIPVSAAAGCRPPTSASR